LAKYIWTTSPLIFCKFFLRKDLTLFVVEHILITVLQTKQALVAM